MTLNRPSDGEAQVLELWGMWSTASLSLLPGPLWPGVVVPITAAQSAGIVEYSDCISAEGYDPLPPMSVLDITQNHLIMNLQSQSFGNVEYFYTAIIPRSTLTQSSNTYKGLIYESNRSVYKSLVLGILNTI